MKKSFFCLISILLIMGCKSAPATNPNEVPLETAIREAAALMETRLEAGTKIALINFTSPSQTFSEYVLDELSSVLVNNGVLTVVDRASLDKVRQELNFNMSGEVSDQSAQEIGKMLGAQAIVTGSLTSIGDLRRVMFKAIITETAAVAIQHPADIINDARIQALLSNRNGSQTAAYGGNSGTTVAGNSTETTTRAKAAGPQNGTYTFYPRLQPYQGALLQDGVYLYQIVVRGEYMNIYLCRNATGRTVEDPRGEWLAFANNWQSIVLQDLDNPALSYNPEPGMGGNGSNYNAEGQWYSFKGVKSTRFSLTNNRGTSSTFEEIVLGEPDA